MYKTEETLTILLQIRAKNLEEHRFLVSEIKAAARSFSDLGKRLEADPQYGFDISGLHNCINSLEDKQRRSRSLWIEITEANLELQRLEIPLNGI